MKRATLRDVAEHAGVSKATVSYILNGSNKTITKETRERVEKAIKELNYIPNLGAVSLTSKCSKLIGVVVPQTEPGSELMFKNSFYSEILSSIEYHARVLGYHIIISASDVNESYMKLVVERNLDGVIVIGMYPDDFYKQFKKIEVPVVLIDSYCVDEYFHNIRIDDELGEYISTKYVLDHGHKKVAIVSGMRHENGVVQKRIDGYKKALIEKGLPFDESLIFEGDVNYEFGVEAAKKIVASNKDITAIVTTADALAIGVIKGMAQLKKSIPNDYSIVGFDDLEVSAFLPVGLTTVKQDIAKKGELAVELLAKSMENPSFESQDIVLPVGIVERESVLNIK
ncbi:MAG: LacI family DNA-binding transcriptional regulator [Lachnospiraceae bacterium]|nr:LacI family DNA-binding transcriptional regulator [Lachnospiraceae bacterium]